MPVSSPPAFNPAVAPIALGAAGTVLTGNGVTTAPTFQAAAAGASGANPTASVGLVAVNGVLTTFLRSDGAPPLDQTISPTMTGVWTFSSTEPRILFNETDQGANLKLWDFDLAAGVLAIRTRTDADGAGVNAVAITRGATTAITNLTFGNATNNPTFTFSGTGAATFGASVAASRFSPTGATAPSTAGIYLPGTNRLGFGIVSANVGEFDASGNFLTRKGVADPNYSKQTPTTGFAITIADNTQTLILKPAGTLATGTITMPANPIEGQQVRIMTSQIITALTLSPNSGQTIIAAPATLGAGQGVAFIYSVADTTWYRMYLGN